MSKLCSRKEYSISTVKRRNSFGSEPEKDRSVYRTYLDESASDPDFLNVWLQMHVTGGTNGTPGDGNLSQRTQSPGVSGLVVSRKRKAWEPLSVGNKYVGLDRTPVSKGSDDEERTTGLQTPHCSRTGFEDGDVSGGELSGNSESGVSASKSNILSPMNPNLLNVEDIDADNLAADFDESFTGLGVDINTTNYSMSEAMLSINNIALSNHLKQEGGRSSKSESNYIFANYGALDLSNDDAQNPDNEDNGVSGNLCGLQSFSGRVSRDNSQDSMKAKILERKPSKSSSADLELSHTKAEHCSPIHHYSHAGAGFTKSVLMYGKGDIDDLGSEDLGYMPPKLEHLAPIQVQDDDPESRFQYILTAPTSIATKLGDPSLTYINQGQSYELKIKKLGDLSCYYKKKWLRSTIRICFHERRLQYIENEQIQEWARTHPNERIVEVDLPLSYGIAEVKQDSSNLSTIAFSWDPTRETGIFVKVHCISTEFTPKKHGGERGVPFRLQVETWSSESRIHAAACILQVFKLKGADRKHKQDREKVQKRSITEQEKFSPQYECTVLTDLSVDSIYIPPSRGISPVQSDGEGSVIVKSAPSLKSSSVPPNTSREEPFLPVPSWISSHKVGSTAGADSKSWKVILPNNASAETTAGWLSFNRYEIHVKTFQNYDSRDILRLSKDDLVQMIGLMDGVRLFNDLHMKPVAPRLTIYIAQKGDSVFHPFLLEDVTVLELIKLMAHTFEIPESFLAKIVMSGPNKILVRMTDEYLRYQNPDSAFHLHIVYDDNGESCTVHLEPISFQ
ncbi:transcription factor CP2-like protein 1 [Eurytemora carolleeae]|uniref:transcription factor CP2-like protein 1 n=1 Tax=Eurytemora carolleeae TaxID=1294199 RepID=UPI000C761287|nr:transcription factor CP2-like protein 1 [Eurytemora carolleeae]XP_023320795.1 transcription factor CP2-like protein 1 [Eurytemora carolleeae]|eukprot:XP_023320794.1 transcription factor CP2-like protein 1 [Eurytemora affinis]